MVRHCRFCVGLVLGVLLSVAALGGLAYTTCLEPRWVAVRTVRLAEPPSLRLIHISDLHYAGDRAYLGRVVSRINALGADVVCFTGDLVDDTGRLAEALALLRQVRMPMYGVRGNHDGFDAAELDTVRACFAASGGRWLMDEREDVPGQEFCIFGSTGKLGRICPSADATRRLQLLLVHDPAIVEHLAGVRFDLILAGHTHGGQVCLPGRGPLLDLPLLGRYVRGLYQTPAGPLYVNPGLGTFLLRIRFACRPEITVIER